MVSTHRVWSNRAGQSVMTSAMMVCICRCCCWFSQHAEHERLRGCISLSCLKRCASWSMTFG